MYIKRDLHRTKKEVFSYLSNRDCTTIVSNKKDSPLIQTESSDTESNYDGKE